MAAATRSRKREGTLQTTTLGATPDEKLYLDVFTVTPSYEQRRKKR